MIATHILFEDVAGMAKILCIFCVQAQKSLPQDERLRFGTDIIGDLVLLKDASPIIATLAAHTQQAEMTATPSEHFHVEQAQRLLGKETSPQTVTVSIDEARAVFAQLVAKYRREGISDFNAFRDNLWRAVGTYVPHYRKLGGA